MKNAKILHLSDLHTGMSGSGWLWPNFKTILFEDLRRLHKKTGNWDIVVFSGDLTQRSSVEEFEAFTAILRELWIEFLNLGFNPYRYTQVP